jgi:hypothetical protein
VLIAVLCATAFVAGLTGTWSPCGFSMVETLGAAAHRGQRAVTWIACATFALGALAGGGATFGALALLGDAVKGVGGAAATTAAVAVAALAAVGEMRGTRIVPQIRRQVPEPWRRRMPLPIASALYGVLLGLGFTTFVLTWAVWALAGIGVALGDPAAGVAIGIAFGAGRALPVVVMAPSAWTGRGARVLATMAERPGSLRLARGADAIGLAAVAVLLAAGPAYAAVVDPAGMDPSATRGATVWDRPGIGGILQDAAGQRVLPGDIPAVGGSLVAWRNGAHVTIAPVATLRPSVQFDAPGVDKLALSNGWVAVRRTIGRRQTLEARSLATSQTPRRIASVNAPDSIGRPMIDGQRLVFGLARGTRTSIVADDLSVGRRQTLRRGASVQFLNPSALKGSLLYVEVTRCAQELRLATGGRERVLLRAAPIAAQDVGYEPGHTSQGSRRPCPGGPRAPGRDVMWTTALAPRAALVTMLHVQAGGALRPSLVSVPR